jgi:RNA polymerase sigma-70 factor (ECF subfamily)
LTLLPFEAQPPGDPTLAGAPPSFDCLVARYWGQVFGAAFRLMGDREDAEDQAQEVFLKVFRSLDTLHDPLTLGAWIMRITVNTCLDALDRRKRSPATVPLIPPASGSIEELRFADTREPTPEEALLGTEARAALLAALARLDARTREVLVLRDIEGHSYHEIGATLALGPSAVKMRIHRARAAFRQELRAVDPELAR